MTSVTRADRRAGAGLTVVLLAAFMGQVDMFVVNVAAPRIQETLGAGFGQMQLVVSGYVVAYAAGLVTGGRLGDRWGRRRVFGHGAAWFTVTSLACALAPTVTTLIVARVLQGAAAAVLMPQVLALVRATFPDGPARARAVGAYGATIGLGVIAGLIGGGLLVDLDVAGLGWRTIFLVNVPIGVAIVVLAPLTVSESRASRAPGPDVAGAVLVGLALPAVLLPVSLGAESDWPAWGWALVLTGLVLAGLFVAHQRSRERRRGDPIVPPRLFATRGFTAGTATVLAFFCGNAGLFLVLTYHLQSGLGLDPLATGLAFTPLGVGFATGSAVSGRLAARFGVRTATAGAALMLTSLLAVPALTSAAPTTQAWTLATVLGVSGFGQGLVVAPLLSTVLALVGVDDAGAASGVVNTATQVGMAGGVALIGTLYRALLGTDPDHPSIPLGPDAFAAAFDSVAVALAVLAAATAVLLERLRWAMTP